MPRLALFVLSPLVVGALAHVQGPVSRPVEAPPVPTLVAPGLVSTSQGEYSPTFDVARGELYFMRRTPGEFDYTIHCARFEGEAWTEVAVAPFSGQHRDAGPSLSPSGETLWFDSRRPDPGLEPESINLWRVDRTDAGWGEPQLLRAASTNGPQPGRAGADEFGPNVDGAGNLWFYSFREPLRGGARYVSRPPAYEAVELDRSIPDPSAATFVSYLYVSPDGRTALMDGRSARGRDGDVFCSRLGADGVWTTPVPVEGINTPAGEGGAWMTPDGREIFFHSDRPTGDARAGASNLWRVSSDVLPGASGG